MSPGAETIIYAFSQFCWYNINISYEGQNGVNPSLLQR